MNAYLDSYKETVGGDMMGKCGIRYVITDSWEAGSQNWTDDMIADFLQSPQAIVGGSDAGAHVKTFCGGGNTSLLLAKWVKNKGILSLPEAVRRITSEPAQVLGLAGRGPGGQVAE